MAELTIDPASIRKALDDFVSSYKPSDTPTQEVGYVATAGDGIAHVTGLPGCMANELLTFEDGTLGLAFNLDAREIGVVILGDFAGIEEGQEVRRTGEVLSVPVGDGYLGRVVDPLGKPLDALPILKRIEGNKTAKKRMEAYVYQLIGRWKDTRGTEYVFREDGSCCIAGKEGYFGGSGYEITVGDEPYPTKGEYSVVSVRGKTVTLRGLQSGRTIRLSYLGEPTDREESADNPEN